MKLLRYGSPGSEKPGMLDADGKIRSLEGVIDDLAGDALSDASIKKIGALDPTTLPEVDASTRIGPCVTGVGKIMCIGLNYSDHAAESGMEVPPEPVIFMKATSAISGPDDNVVIPRNSKKSDWESSLVW